MTPTESRSLPHNLEAERSILGAILVENESLSVVARALTPADFYLNGHALIFQSMVALNERGSAIDFVTLKDELGLRKLEEAGGPAYLASLSDGVPRTTNVEYYARIVKEKADLRGVIFVTDRAQAAAYEGSTPASEIVARVSDALARGARPLHAPDKLHTRGPSWPAPIAAAAYHGPIGDLVRLVEPHSEADPAALLLQALVMMGNIAGPRVHLTVSGARHSLALYATLVGLTSKGRKGTSYNSIALPLKAVDPALSDPDRVTSGLSSGEGLIWSVRDAICKGDEIIEPGVIDKRKLVVEGEFASVLKQFAREGNTLSPVVRQAWDSGTLGTLTKSSTAKATGALISIIGHITRDELLRYMTATEAGNGFGNRFLWVCTTRSKVLPEGGELHRVDFGAVVRRLQAAMAFANQDLELRRNESAKQLWAEVYRDLSDGQPGMFGAMTSRAEAQVLRIAGIYAVTDLSEMVTVDHLKAALEVWRYCSDSVAFIFGTSLGDPVADEIDAALRGAGEDGLTRTELRDLFGRNKKSDQIERGLGVLEEHGRVRRRRDQSKPGRPIERWVHVANDRNDQIKNGIGAKGVYVVGRRDVDAETPVYTNDINDITTKEKEPQFLRPTTKPTEHSGGLDHGRF